MPCRTQELERGRQKSFIFFASTLIHLVVFLPHAPKMHKMALDAFVRGCVYTFGLKYRLAFFKYVYILLLLCLVTLVFLLLCWFHLMYKKIFFFRCIERTKKGKKRNKTSFFFLLQVNITHELQYCN
jgi:hypothetical protein